MTAEHLFRLYEAGAIVKGHLLRAMLDRLDPADADATLRVLPPDLWPDLGALLGTWEHGRMLSTHGPVVTPPENVRAAREWLRARQRIGVGPA
jgi:hypothetical protein